MRRRLLNLLTALSLVLCVAAVALWVRSYAYGDDIQMAVRSPEHGSLGYAVLSDSGELVLWRTSAVGLTWPTDLAWRVFPVPSRVAPRRTQAAQCDRHLLGFGLTWRPVGRTVVVPYYALVLPPAAIPAIRFIAAHRVRRRRRRPGLCPTCGYNLTANVSGVCPEMFSVL